MTQAFDPDELGRWLAAQSRTIHMVGIGGVGMAGLAHLLSAMGHRVSGTDQLANPWTRQLTEHGVGFAEGHHPDFVPKEVELCIHTTAVPPDHKEIAQARLHQARVHRRGEVLAAVSHRRGSIAVSGTHGKTTTTSMTHFLFTKLGQLPDFFIGAQPAHTDRVAGWTGADFFCLEADESDGTLVHYQPETLVITNIDFDHMEHHADEAAFFAMFQTAVDRTGQTLICPAEDGAIRRLSIPDRLQIVETGLGVGSGLRAEILEAGVRHSMFRLRLDGKELGVFRLGVPGLHNVRNALTALAVMESQGLSVADAAGTLTDYRSAERRLECLLDEDVQVYTDYAHHPTEIAAILDAVESWPKQRTVVIFQPHRYTRTLALKQDFARVLRRADVLVLAPVYAASEDPIPRGETEDLVREVAALTSGKVIYAKALDDVQDLIHELCVTGDLLLFLGAGDIDAAAREFAQSKKENVTHESKG